MLNRLTTVLLAVSFASCVLPSWGDDISPGMNNGDREYSSAKADSAFFGTGPAGRLSEASNLRFLGQNDLDSGDYEAAIAKFGKAVKLDPGDPDTHVLYARALTGKFFANKGTIDEKLLTRCLEEWRVIWHHDADQENQAEAKWQVRKLARIEKALQKEKEERQKEQESQVAESQKDAQH